MKTFYGAAVLLLVCAIASTCQADLRYRPTSVSYAFQYRSEQVAPAPKVPSVPSPVVPAAHIQDLLLRQVKRVGRPVPHFPTRRPMQAVDRLHTRVDIGHQQSAHPSASGIVSAHAPGTVVAHSHTEVYRKYR